MSAFFFFFPHIRKFSVIISSNIFASTFILFSFWDPYKMNVDTFNITPRVSEAIFIHLYSFFSPLLWYTVVISEILFSRSLICCFISLILLLILSNVFYFIYCSATFFFSTSSSLLIISCIFLILTSIVFQRSWIILLLLLLFSC